METRWVLDGEGFIITPNQTKIYLDKLAIIKNNTVTDIYGNPVPIQITNADRLSGHDINYFLTVDKVPVTTVVENSMVKLDLTLTDTTVNLSETSLSYIGQSTKITTSPMLIEILPNVKFNTLVGIIYNIGTNISLVDNTLHISSDTIDYPSAYEVFELEANVYYLFRITATGESPAIKITDPNDEIFIDVTPIDNKLELILNPSITGEYKLHMIKNSTKDITDSAIFTLPSVREIDVTNLNHNDYYTINTPTGINTVITTKVLGQDINYNINNKYNKITNPIAFIKDSFTLLKYKSDTEGLVGYVKIPNTNLYKEFFINSKTNIYVGDFNSVNDLELFNITSNNSEKLLEGEALLFKRITANNIAELSFTNDTEINTNMLFEFYIREIVGEWYVSAGELELPILLTNDGDTDRDRVFRFVYKTTSNKTTFKLKCRSLDTTSYIKISSLHGYTLDNDVWEDITPKSNNSYTSTFDINTIDMDITSIDNTITTVNYNSLLGINTLIPSDTYSTTSAIKRYNSLLKIEDNRITLGSYDIGCNKKNIEHICNIRYMDKLIMYRDNNGTLSLIAFNSVTNYSLILTNISNTITTIPHLVNSKPISITKYPITYNGNIVSYLRTDNNIDRNIKYTPYKNTQPINIKNTNSEIGIFTDKDFTIYNNDVNRGIVLYRCIGENDHRKIITYRGNNKPISIPYDYDISNLTIIPLDNNLDKTKLDISLGYNNLLTNSKITNNNIFYNSNSLVITNNPLTNENNKLYLAIINGYTDKNTKGILTTNTKITTKLNGIATIVLNNKTNDGTANNLALFLNNNIISSITKINLK